MNSDRIECVARVGAPVERVWPLIADGAGIRRWFAFDGAELDAVPGGAAVFEWAEHGRFLGVVEDVRPERLLTVRWALVPDVAPDPGNATLVEFPGTGWRSAFPGEDRGVGFRRAARKRRGAAALRRGEHPGVAGGAVLTDGVGRGPLRRVTPTQPERASRTALALAWSPRA
ncbi:SRPBCC domain-containing protein [Spiractinospora alimapuensis]|nr:SRPBCC domain-containing protein [Spiractinospora alimapuensis]